MRRVIGFVGSKSKTRYLNQISSGLFESDLIKRKKKQLKLFGWTELVRVIIRLPEPNPWISLVLFLLLAPKEQFDGASSNHMLCCRRLTAGLI